MAQSTDIVLSDQLGAPFRAELNQILSALGTDNSGNSEPLNTYQFMKWVDTSNATYYYFKERNHDNTAWVTLFRYTVATKIMEAVSDEVTIEHSKIVAKDSPTGSAMMPAGTTAQRPVSPSNGYMRYNTDLLKFEGYQGGVWNTLGGLDINTLTIKTTPIDADEMVLADSTSSFSLKKFTWANLKATLLVYFDTLYSRTTAIFGVGQTWQDMTASRVLGTTYTNSTGKPISLSVWCIGTAAFYNLTININAVATYFNQDYANTAGYSIGATIIIPNGATYSIVVTSMTLTKWFELR